MEAGVGIEPAYTALQGKILSSRTITYGTIPDKTASCNFRRYLTITLYDHFFPPTVPNCPKTFAALLSDLCDDRFEPDLPSDRADLFHSPMAGVHLFGNEHESEAL